MKYAGVLLAVAAVSGSFAVGPALGYWQAGPQIEFNSTTINYGEVTKDKDSGERELHFVNTGDAPLLITNVTTTCGCLVPDWTRDPVMPGKTGKIVVTYSMKPGPIRKSVTVHSNAVNFESGIVVLSVKGNVLSGASGGAKHTKDLR